MTRIILCSTTQYFNSEGTHVVDPDDYELSMALIKAKRPEANNTVYIHSVTCDYSYHLRPEALRILFDIAQEHKTYHFGVIDPK